MITKSQKRDILTDEITKYREQFGPRPLTEKERNKIEESLEKIRAIPPEEIIGVSIMVTKN